MTTTLILFRKILLSVSCVFFLSRTGLAQSETLSPGAFIINMGVVPQTTANALKPYGLIYDLMRNNNVPIKWVVSQTKLKDGVDFTYNGVAYKGGTFIIPAEFRTAAVNAKILAAAPLSGLGVIGVTTTSPLTVSVTQNLTSIPKWTLDDQNGAKAEAYLIAAGITNTLFPGAYNWKAPATLDCCDDFFVMPHADPIWATHSRLLSWNLDCKGSIWAACHATSALENMVNPTLPITNRSTQTNFLTQKVSGLAGTSGNYALSNSLILWGKHSGGSVPYVHQYPNDIVAQYMGPTDLAHQNGSEQIDVPNQAATGGWNPGAKIIAYDPTQADVTNPLRPDKSNAAAVIVYGRGFDDPNRGYVMYEPAHSHAGTAPNNIAAQRVFLNFSFFQVQPKAPQLGAISGLSSGQLIQGGSPVPLSITASSILSGITFTYQWISSCGGTFSAPTSASTNFTPTAVVANTPCIITCVVTDNCGRKSFQSVPITVVPPPAPPTPQPDAATLAGGCAPGTSVTLDVLTNDTDPQGATFSFTSLNLGTASPANAGTWSNVGGSVTFVPDPNFSGAATITYTVTNSFGLTANATITVNVGTADVDGCFPNQVYAPLNTGFLNLTDNFVSQSGTTAAATETSLDDVEDIYASSGEPSDFINMDKDATDLIILSIPAPALRAKDSINIYWSKATNASVGTLSVSIGTSATGPWTNTQTFTITPNGVGAAVSTISVYALPTGASGITHVRISSGIPSPATGSAAVVSLDAVEYEYLSCVDRKPVAQNDAVVLLEDVPTVISVLNNDSDPVGSAMTVSAIVTPPANGKVSINNDGTITYINTTDFSGSDAFTYRVCNALGYCATATVDITIKDDVGCAAGEYRPNPPGGPQTKVFQSGFAGTNAATANGTANNFADTYLDQSSGGNDNRNGNNLKIGYRFSDTKAARAVAWFNISEIPATAVVQSANFSLLRSGGDGNTQTINLHPLTKVFNQTQATWLNAATAPAVLWTTAGGDFGTSLASTSVTSAKIRYNWSSTNFTNQVQTWVTTPANNFGMLLKTDETLAKRHEFYRNEDGTATRRSILTISYVVPEPCTPIPNRNPLANPDTTTTNSITPVTISPLLNDADADAGQTISLLSIGTVTGGTAIVSGSTIIFTPTFGFNGTATVIYNIQDNGTPILQDQSIVYIKVTNSPPTANKDISSANSGTNQVINVVTGAPAPAGTDVDPEGGALSAPVITLNPKNGSASFAGNVLTYIPNPGFTGNDTLIYQLCEATAGACSPAPFCDTALVVFTVVNQLPVAVADSKTGKPCQPMTITLLGNDTDPEGGKLTVTGISALSNPAAGVLTNNGDGSVTFVPATGFVGSVTFTYTVLDDGITPQTSAPATVTINIVNSANVAPIAADDVADPQNIGEVVYTSVKDNDSDPDNDPTGPPAITVNPLHGTAIVLENGLIQYTPNPGYYGTDVLTYQICDTVSNPATCTKSVGLCDLATVSYIIVPPINTTNAFNDEHSTWQDINVSSNVLTNDNDLEGDAQVLGGFYNKDLDTYQTSGTFNVYAEDGVTVAGTITIAANGDFTFDPLPTFSGVVSIPYYVNDVTDPLIKASTSDSAVLKITVSPLPVLSNSVIANNDEYVTPLNTDVNSSVTAYNDFDPQGNTFTVTSYTFDTDGNGTQDGAGTMASPIQIGGISTTGIPTTNAGTLTLNADGTFTFNPQNDFTGSIDVVYTITDALGATTTAVLHIDILPDVNGAANDAPFAGDDFKYTNVNTPVSGNALSNDSDPNAGNTIAATPQTTTIVGVGTLVLAANGNYTFTPAPGYTGPAAFPYTICDNQAPPLCTEATLHFLVGVDNSTDAVNDENSTWQDVNVSGGVVANDFDAENNTQTFGSFLAQGATPGAPIASGATVAGVDKLGAPVASAGTITFAADGSYTFDPSPTFTGTVTVPYRLCDNGNLSKCDTAYLTITVDPYPSTTNSVIANNDENISYGAAVSGDVDVNDRDPQGNPFTVTAVTGGTPGAPFTVAGTDANGNPVANAGTLVINADGTYTYTPTAGFVGSINVPYTITDALGATSTAVLHIDVVRDPNGPANDPPVAGDDFNYTNVNTPVNGSFINNDSDPNANPVSINGTTIVPAGPATPVGAPVPTAQGGTVQFYANGTYLYTPPAGYVGPDNVNYTICDVTAIAPQPLCNTAMIHLLVGVDNSTDAVNDENSTWQDVNVSGGVVANDFDAENNTQTFGSFLAQGATPGAPIASGATVAGVDKLGAPVASAGTITFAADGSYTFDPSPTFTGTVTVPYRLCDNGNLSKCDTAYLTITVDPYPSTTNSVIANNDENISYGAAVSGDVDVNDRDPQGNPFTVTAVTGGTPGAPFTVAGTDANGNPVANAGTLVINADGTYTYTPTAGFVGSINVPYTITDALGATSTAVLHIDVVRDPNGPANDPPVAGDDFNYTNVNTPVNGSFINNDSDPNANPVSINGTTIVPAGPATPVGAPVPTAQGGTVQFYANGTYLYTPPAGYVGPDNVNYTICDVTAIAPQPLCNTAMIHLLVGVDNSTDAVNDENSTWQDVNVSGGVVANDFDAENNTQTFGSFLAQGATPGAPIASGATVAGVDKLGAPVASAGTITFAADGSYTFDPSPTFTGTVTVPYRLCDNGNLSKCDTAYLTITVDPLPTSGINTVIANNDENISYGGPVSNTLFANDRDPQGDAFTVTAVTGGTPGAPFTVAGTDANGNPVANAGTLVINADGTYTFTPTAGFVGSINVPYTITDALGATSTAVLHIDVVRDPNGPLNDPPFAGDDFGYTTVNKPVSGNFIGNDTDPNSNPLSYMGTTIVPAGPATPIGAPVATAQGGTVQFYANGTYLYTPPVGYVGPDNVNYTVCDVTAIAPQPLCTDAQIHLLIGPGVSIAGKVWDDADGNVIDAGAGEPETNIGGTLYVNLVDALGNVVATTAVLPDGSYSFTNITPGVSYTVQLSTNQGVVGNPAPAVALPAGWVNTGETRNGIIDGGTLGVIDTRNYGFTNTINFDFGIEQLPNTDPHTTNIPQPTVNQFITLNGGANPPILSGIDPEDCSGGCTLASKSVIIDVLPANSELYYNGILVTAGQQINNFDPSLLQVKITSATLGAVSTSFQYSFVDAAGKKDPTPATYTLTWLTPLPVTGLYVTARLNNAAAIIDWKTETEINSDYFVVERSTDNVNFTQVGTVAAAGNSTTPRNYSFTDDITALMQNDVVYYRIRQIDIDARFKFSNVAIVKMTKTVGIQAWPNPFTESISININSTAASQINIKLINVPGQVLRNQSQSISRGTTQVTMRNLNNLASGIYFLQIEDSKGGISEVIKFVKE